MAAPPEGGAAPAQAAYRFVVFASLAVVAVAAWAFLVRGAAVMEQMHGGPLLLRLATAMMAPGQAGPYLAATAVMWSAMVLAMMIPAVTPAVQVFLKLDRGRAGAGRAADGLAFAGGYLLVWLAFGVAGSVLQWGLHRAALLGTGRLSLGPAAAGGVLVGAGLYQLSPLKETCLRHCQSPLGFLLGHWRAGAAGALRMGSLHGAYCLGCCWALMLVMFAGGVMSVATMALLSAFILAERLLPPGAWSAWLPGWLLVAWGGAMLVGAR
ncbi:MAG: DUF2182 domain-containing protein [Nevskia sp.]|nr:DUF2182 domain-containing protein [Nevskia sp.]